MELPVRTTVVIDGKEYPITKLPPAPIDPDLHFDRFAHDDAGHSPDISRSTILANKSFNEPMTANGKRTGKRKQAE
jgi:hypothetical protein